MQQKGFLKDESKMIQETSNFGLKGKDHWEKNHYHKTCLASCPKGPFIEAFSHNKLQVELTKNAFTKTR